MNRSKVILVFVSGHTIRWVRLNGSNDAHMYTKVDRKIYVIVGMLHYLLIGYNAYPSYSDYSNFILFHTVEHADIIVGGSSN